MTIAVGGMLVVRIIQLKCVNYNTYNKISYLIQIFFLAAEFLAYDITCHQIPSSLQQITKFHFTK